MIAQSLGALPETGLHFQLDFGSPTAAGPAAGGAAAQSASAAPLMHAFALTPSSPTGLGLGMDAGSGAAATPHTGSAMPPLQDLLTPAHTALLQNTGGLAASIGHAPELNASLGAGPALHAKLQTETDDWRHQLLF